MKPFFPDPIQPYPTTREWRLSPGIPELADQGVDLGSVQTRIERGRLGGLRCRVNLEDDIRWWTGWDRGG